MPASPGTSLSRGGRGAEVRGGGSGGSSGGGSGGSGGRPITTSTLSGASTGNNTSTVTISESAAARDRDRSGSAVAAAGAGAGASVAGGAGAGRRGDDLRDPIRCNTSAEVQSPSQSCDVRAGGGGVGGGGSGSGGAGSLSSLLSGTSSSAAAAGGGYIPEPHPQPQPQPQNNLAGFSFPSSGMDANRLQQQLKEFTESLFSEGLLDEQFTQLQMLQDESNPDFVAEVVSLFFEDSEKLLEQLTESLEGEPIDYKKVDAHVHQFKGSSSSIGALRVKTGCISFRQCCEDENVQGCRQALVQVKHEFLLVKTKLEAMLALEQQLLAAGGTLPYNDLE